MNKILLIIAFLGISHSIMAADLSHGADNFYQSKQVTIQKVSFTNQYKMKVI